MLAEQGISAQTQALHEVLTLVQGGRVQKRHDALRQAGLRRIQLWVPDTRRPGFAQECWRQCLLAAQADSANAALPSMNTAPSSVDGWTG